MRKHDPMPTPYTTEDTGYPVGLYMPGHYYTADYLEWISRRQPIPYQERHFDADEAVAPLTPQRFFTYRTCQACEITFMPESAGQAVCMLCQRKQIIASGRLAYEQRRRGAA